MQKVLSILGCFSAALALAAASAPESGIVCGQPGDLIPDSASCERYFICDDRLKPVGHECEKGLVFNAAAKSCQRPQFAVCAHQLSRKGSKEVSNEAQREPVNASLETIGITATGNRHSLIARVSRRSTIAKREETVYLSTEAEVVKRDAAPGRPWLDPAPALGNFKNSPRQRPFGHIYLTFDDGPNDATIGVSRVLREEGVQATFFVNTEYLGHADWQAPKQAFLALVRDGHFIGDHSYGHMKRENGQYHYLDADEDSRSFGQKNAALALQVLKDNSFPLDSVAKVNESMQSFARLPFCNYWRLQGISIDDPYCLSDRPVSLHVADKLRQEYNYQVYGWDKEWLVDYANGIPLISGQYMLKHILSPSEAFVSERKFVLLTHDAGFASQRGQQELGEFIRAAKEKAFVFRTLDTYLED